ncbi:MAG: nitrilase-related carbon-nitrogen hydrolase, partial [Rubricoccaceae bacterium]|nr:nitrilase-related carbon-nitrogen hydrolase [Rubricoccaceae bacterium]
MRTALVQFNPQYLEIEQNLDTVEDLLSGVDADLIILPEFFATGYFFHSHEDVQSAAEAIPGARTTQRIAEWARNS